MRAQALIFLCLFLASANSRMLRFKNEILMLIDYLRNLQRLEMLSLEKKNKTNVECRAQHNQITKEWHTNRNKWHPMISFSIFVLLQSSYTDWAEKLR